MENRNFVIFSNTIEEYEAFINKGVFYWPNEIAKLTPFQRGIENIELQEKIGDKVLIVVGAKMKNIKDTYLKERITNSPMITHIAEVSEIYERPVLGYRYTHGKNPSSSFMLPFEFLPQFKELPNYLGKEFTEIDLLEIDKAIEFGECINELLNNEITFTRAFFKDDSIYIQSENEEEVFELTPGFPTHRKIDRSINNALTYRELPDLESLQKIVSTCNEKGLDGDNLILNLRTWRGSKFMKLEVLEEEFRSLNGKLQEGISTRLLTTDDVSDHLLNEIQNYLKNNSENEVGKMGFSKNTILYGPPGTGKTYKVIEKAVNIINPNFSNDAPTRSDYEEAYRTYIEKKQIQFCTFHQSFSYEDFVEGLRSDIEKEGAPFTPQNGVFKEICELAKSSYQLSTSPSIDIDRSKIYKISLGQANSIQGEKIYRYCIDNKVITLGHGSKIDFTEKNSFNEVSDAFSSLVSSTNSSVINMVNHFKNELKIGDIVIVSKGNLKFRAIAKVTGDYFYDEETDIPYNHFRKVEWLYISSNGEIAEQILNQAYSGSSQFSQVSIYPFSEGQLNNKEIKKYITSNETSEEERFVLIIDEINRGNISKIFGELITLIEEDKRFDVEADGTIKGLEVTLPYSKDKFSVPKSVYILGTMNTADRSISLMDTALRRRFDFEEMLPEPNVLSEVDEINVQKLLQKINQRIEYLYDRDHQIGHAFFIGKESSDELLEVMQRKVIPLLQEYFYDDWEKIELVLGGAAKSESEKNDYFLFKQTLNANNLFNKTSKILSKKVIYSVVKEPSTQALLNIYEDESVATNE